jgi:glycosyltransferase involved in cell wall biosynthesis
LAWHLFQKRDLKSAQVLHATSREEADGFLKVGLRQPITLIPNGVDLPRLMTDHRTRSTDRRTLLSLSRLHRVKGLQNLVQAWAAVRSQGWEVVLAGEDANGHQAELEAAIRAGRMEGDFKFIGPVDGKKKWELYRSADLFVLPSHTENFGLAVAEALACSVPVITTRATPWEELETHDCGWWVDVGAQSLAEALRAATAMNDEKRRAMGQRGRQLIEQKYTWSAAAQKFVAVYEWMLERGPKPEWVI